MSVQDEAGLSIAEAASVTGLSAHTLRYYERAGLLPSISRNAGGHRRYLAQDLNLLIFLTRLRMTGMPIHQVREYATLARAGEETTLERKALLERHRENVCRRIGEMERNLAVLDFKIGLYASGWAPIGIHDPQLTKLKRLCTEIDLQEGNGETS